jgi:hypothetical protein
VVPAQPALSPAIVLLNEFAQRIAGLAGLLLANQRGATIHPVSDSRKLGLAYDTGISDSPTWAVPRTVDRFARVPDARDGTDIIRFGARSRDVIRRQAARPGMRERRRGSNNSACLHSTHWFE